MRYGLVACGSNGDRMVGLDDLVGPFQPCDCVIYEIDLHLTRCEGVKEVPFFSFLFFFFFLITREFPI